MKWLARLAILPFVLAALVIAAMIEAATPGSDA